MRYRGVSQKQAGSRPQPDAGRRPRDGRQDARVSFSFSFSVKTISDSSFILSSWFFIVHFISYREDLQRKSAGTAGSAEIERLSTENQALRAAAQKQLSENQALRAAAEKQSVSAADRARMDNEFDKKVYQPFRLRLLDYDHFLLRDDMTEAQVGALKNLISEAQIAMEGTELYVDPRNGARDLDPRNGARDDVHSNAPFWEVCRLVLSLALLLQVPSIAIVPRKIIGTAIRSNFGGRFSRWHL